MYPGAAGLGKLESVLCLPGLAMLSKLNRQCWRCVFQRIDGVCDVWDLVAKVRQEPVDGSRREFLTTFTIMNPERGNQSPVRHL